VTRKNTSNALGKLASNVGFDQGNPHRIGNPQHGEQYVQFGFNDLSFGIFPKSTMTGKSMGTSLFLFGSL